MSSSTKQIAKRARQYQIDAVDAFTEYYYNYGYSKGILSMFCGTGKSFTLYLSMLEAYSRGAHVIVYCTPRLELIGQIIENIQDYHQASQEPNIIYRYSSTDGAVSPGINVRRFNPSEQYDGGSLVFLVTTYDTFAGKNKKVRLSEKNTEIEYGESIRQYFLDGRPVDLFIFDESHHIGHTTMQAQKCMAVLEGYSEAKVVFATATPTRYVKLSDCEDDPFSTRLDMSNTAMYGEIYFEFTYADALQTILPDGGSVVSPYTVTFMSCDNYNIYKKQKLHEDVIILRWFLNMVSATGCKKSIIFTPQQGIAKRYINIINDLRGLSFTPETKPDSRIVIQHANTLLNVYLGGDGIKSFEARRKIKRQFELDETPHIIVCVQALNEGVDLPSCDSILFSYDKSTCTETTLVQNIGRALRRNPANPTKVARIFIPTVMEVYANHCGSTKFSGIRRTLSELPMKTPGERKFYTSEKLSGHFRRPDRAATRGEQQTYEEVCLEKSRADLKMLRMAKNDIPIGALTWDPLTGCVVDEPTGDKLICKSIGNISIREMRAYTEQYCGDPFGSVVDREALYWILQCMRVNACRCENFLCHSGVPMSYCSLLDSLEKIKEEFCRECHISKLFPYITDSPAEQCDITILKDIANVIREETLRLVFGALPDGIMEEQKKQHEESMTKSIKYNSICTALNGLIIQYVTLYYLRQYSQGDYVEIYNFPPEWTWNRVYAEVNEASPRDILKFLPVKEPLKIRVRSERSERPNTSNRIMFSKPDPDGKRTFVLSRVVGDACRFEELLKEISGHRVHKVIAECHYIRQKEQASKNIRGEIVYKLPSRVTIKISLLHGEIYRTNQTNINLSHKRDALSVELLGMIRAIQANLVHYQ